MGALWLLWGASRDARASEPARVSLDVRNFSHITLGSRPPTRYGNDGAVLSLQVERSASFLLQGFARPRRVRAVALRWKSSGALQVESARAEETRAGDDYRLRIGLLVMGDPPLLPFFAPAWLRAVRDHLQLPSGRVVYVVCGARHPPGASWKSPYSSSLEYLAAQAVSEPDGWTRASAVLPAPLSIVGLWLMADGDDSGSSFRTLLADLELE
jgi:hypothetical protein